MCFISNFIKNKVKEVYSLVFPCNFSWHLVPSGDSLCEGGGAYIGIMSRVQTGLSLMIANQARAFPLHD